MKIKFSDQTIPFLTKAGQQTDPTWLDDNQSTYDQIVRLPFLEIAQTLKAQLQSAVPNYHFPTKGIGRIKKASNKVVSGGACYKDWLSISASKPSDSRFERNPHLFFGILPNIPPYMGVVVAGGLFMPSSPQLKKIRNAIAQNSEPFHRLFNDSDFKARFKSRFSHENTSSRPPRGIDPDHPDMDWLKLKAFLVVKKISKTEFASAGLALSVAEDFKQLVRLNRLLEEALEPSVSS
jgi:uncharacterized protein (TIGR02453 family)